MVTVGIIKTTKWQKNAEIPTGALLGVRLKIKIVFCSKLAVPHETEVV